MVVPFIFAFLAVLALIGVAAWLVRRFASSRLGTNTNRGRMPRLAVIDAAAVDGRRRLVLVRRDNIEHLLMIGGPSDIVVESNIVRASQGREQLPQRPGVSPGVAAPEPPRIAPLPDTAWNDAETARDSFDHEPPLMPEPPVRPARPSFADELRRPVPPPPPVERRSEPLPGFTPEQLGIRPEPRPELRPEPRQEQRPEPRPEPRMEPRAEPRPEPVLPRMPSRSEPMIPTRPARPAAEAPKAPPPLRPAPPVERAVAPPPPPPPLPVPPAPPAPPSAQSADQNLAEMAQRLEAALRRPAGAIPADNAPPVAPEPPVRERAAPRSEAPIVPPSPPASAVTPKTSFENLEDEMASLLGRPKSSSSS